MFNEYAQFDPFKGKIICGKCGGNYIKLQSGNRVYPSGRREKITYQCYKTHKSARRDCRNYVQSRQTLEMGFVAAFNKILEADLMDFQLGFDEEAAVIKNRINELLEREKSFLFLDANGYITSQLEDEHNKLIDEIKLLQERLKETKKQKVDNGQNWHFQKNKIYFKSKSQMKSFDGKSFLELVRNIKVLNKNRLLYNFKNGVTVEVEVIDNYRKNDEIGELKVYVNTKT